MVFSHFDRLLLVTLDGLLVNELVGVLNGTLVGVAMRPFDSEVLRLLLGTLDYYYDYLLDS